MEFSIPMALVDYIPVILFFLACANLMRDLYGKMTKASFALFAAGALDITIAGALKVTYKLLYAAGVCDFQPLNAMFFPVQSIGFLLAGIGICLRPERYAPVSDATVFLISSGVPCATMVPP